MPFARKYGGQEMANEFIMTRRKTLLGTAAVAAASTLGSEPVTKAAQPQRPDQGGIR
jgi:hypothetical protein